MMNHQGNILRKSLKVNKEPQ